MQAGLIFHPETDSWGLHLSFGSPRMNGRVTALPSGLVLVTGGFDAEVWDWHMTAEILDPVTAQSTPLDGMSIPRHSHTATVLDSGSVMVAGGSTMGGPTNNAEYLVSPSIPPRRPSGRVRP
jgi:hypothetical protein